jgi:hypothetical protein
MKSKIKCNKEGSCTSSPPWLNYTYYYNSKDHYITLKNFSIDYGRNVIGSNLIRDNVRKKEKKS